MGMPISARERGKMSRREAARLPLRRLASETRHKLGENDALGLAAEIAYYTMFTLPPMIVFLVTLTGIVSHSTSKEVTDRLMTAINHGAPSDTHDLLGSLVRSASGKANGGAAVIAMVISGLVALWSGSNSIQVLIKAFNRAYDIDDHRSSMQRRIVAAGLTLLMMVLAGGAFILFVFGRQIGQWASDQLGIGHAFAITLNVVRWPLGIACILLLLALLYYLGPAVDQSYRWVSPGSLVAGALWVLIAIGLQLYLRLSQPDRMYGALGGVIVLLLYLYLSGLAFLIGAEVNATLARYDPETPQSNRSTSSAVPPPMTRGPS